MSDSEKDFIKAFKKQVIQIAAAYGFILLFSGIGFYYTTTMNLENAKSERLEMNIRSNNIETRMNELNRRKIDKDDVIREFDEIKTLLINVNNKIDRRYGN